VSYRVHLPNDHFIYRPEEDVGADLEEQALELFDFLFGAEIDVSSLNVTPLYTQHDRRLDVIVTASTTTQGLRKLEVSFEPGLPIATFAKRPPEQQQRTQALYQRLHARHSTASSTTAASSSGATSGSQ